MHCGHYLKKLTAMVIHQSETLFFFAACSLFLYLRVNLDVGYCQVIFPPHSPSPSRQERKSFATKLASSKIFIILKILEMHMSYEIFGEFILLHGQVAFHPQTARPIALASTLTRARRQAIQTVLLLGGHNRLVQNHEGSRDRDGKDSSFSYQDISTLTSGVRIAKVTGSVLIVQLCVNDCHHSKSKKNSIAYQRIILQSFYKSCLILKAVIQYPYFIALAAFVCITWFPSKTYLHQKIRINIRQGSKIRK